MNYGLGIERKLVDSQHIELCMREIKIMNEYRTQVRLKETETQDMNTKTLGREEMSELECENADDGEEEGDEDECEQQTVLSDAEEHRVQQAARARERVVQRVQARTRALERLALHREVVEDADAHALRVARHRERLVELVGRAIE